jgi:hypothetical protein
MLIDCRTAHRLMSERLDRHIGRYDRWRLWLHLRLCDWCSRIERHFAFMSRVFKRLDR